MEGRDVMTTDSADHGFFAAEAYGDEPILPEIRDLVDAWLADHPGGTERLIPLLHTVQSRLGYLPFVAQDVVADRLGMSAVEVYGVVSFYHFFTTTPRGRFQLTVCMGTA